MGSMLMYTNIVNAVNEKLELLKAKESVTQGEYSKILDGYHAYNKVRARILLLSIVLIIPVALLTWFVMQTMSGGYVTVAEGTVYDGLVTYKLNGEVYTDYLPEGNLEGVNIKEGKTQLNVYLGDDGTIQLVTRQVDDRSRMGSSDAWILPLILIPLAYVLFIVIVSVVSISKVRKGKAKAYFDYVHDMR